MEFALEWTVPYVSVSHAERLESVRKRVCEKTIRFDGG